MKKFHYEVGCYHEEGGHLQDISAHDTLPQARKKAAEMSKIYPYVEINQVYYKEDEDGIIVDWESWVFVESYRN